MYPKSENTVNSLFNRYLIFSPSRISDRVVKVCRRRNQLLRNQNQRKRDTLKLNMKWKQKSHGKKLDINLLILFKRVFSLHSQIKQNRNQSKPFVYIILSILQINEPKQTDLIVCLHLNNNRARVLFDIYRLATTLLPHFEGQVVMKIEELKEIYKKNSANRKKHSSESKRAISFLKNFP